MAAPMNFKKRERPKVGVGVFVIHDNYPNCVLIGKRKGSCGSGKYSLPGGHLEFGEEWVECGEREVLEETGLVLRDARYCTVVNGVEESEDYHYITIFVLAKVDTSQTSQPQNIEPDKCEEEWVDCGQRETTEETGLKLKDMKFCTVLNVVIPEENYHYIDLFVKGKVDVTHKSQPENLEPSKCEGWEWRDWNDFPPEDQLFCPLRVVRQQGFNPFNNKLS